MFTGAHELLIKIFVGKKFTVVTPLVAELTKYMHNVFSAYTEPTSTLAVSIASR